MNAVAYRWPSSGHLPIVRRFFLTVSPPCPGKSDGADFAVQAHETGNVCPEVKQYHKIKYCKKSLVFSSMLETEIVIYLKYTKDDFAIGAGITNEEAKENCKTVSLRYSIPGCYIRIANQEITSGSYISTRAFRIDEKQAILIIVVESFSKFQNGITDVLKMP